MSQFITFLAYSQVTIKCCSVRSDGITRIPHTHTLIWTMKHFFVRQRYSFLYPLLSAFFPESFLSLTPPPSVCPHLFRAAGREKRRGEQLKWSLAFRLYIGSFPYAQLLGSVHTARLDRVCFLCILPRLVLCVLICDFWFVCVSPIFCVSLSSWVISLTVFGASITNLNEPPRVDLKLLYYTSATWFGSVWRSPLFLWMRRIWYISLASALLRGVKLRHWSLL